MPNKKHKAKKVADPPAVEPTRKPKHNKASSDNNSPPATATGPPIFFFKEDEEYGYFCQWYRCSFTDPDIPGVTFNCAEQYILQESHATAILSTTSPRAQKSLARSRTNIPAFSLPLWTATAPSIVERGNYLEFTQCSNLASLGVDSPAVAEPVALRDLLLATGERELVEASPFDRVWGIGWRAEEAGRVGRGAWGENLLGRALERVREGLREGRGPPAV